MNPNRIVSGSKRHRRKNTAPLAADAGHVLSPIARTKFAKVSVPWYGWNSFVHLSGPTAAVAPTGPFRVIIRLCPASDNRAVVPEPVNDPMQYMTGDSRYRNTVSGYDFAVQIEGSTDILPYKFYSNSDGRVAAIEVSPIAALDLNAALSLGMRVYYTIAVMITAQTQVPINHAAVLTTAASGEWLATLRTESPVVDINPLAFDTNPALRLFMPVYLDGLRSDSPYYALLSFFKIGEFLGREHGYKIRAACLARSLTSQSAKHTIPADPFRLIAPEYVGRKNLDVLEEIEHRYRNNIGHLNANDKYMPSTFAGEEKVRAMAVVARYIASHLVSDALTDIGRLLAAGMTMPELGALFDLDGVTPGQ
jgi:hypothetical protein